MKGDRSDRKDDLAGTQIALRDLSTEKDVKYRVSFEALRWTV